MSGLRISVEGDFKELQEKLKQMGKSDRSELMSVIAEALRTSTDERFDEEMSPDGEAWQRSIRASGGGKTLTASGRLRNSIHARASSAGAEIGTNTIYAATHQFGDSGRTIRANKKPMLAFQIGGTWRRKKQVTVNIPARPFLGMSEEDREEIIRLMEEAVRV